jgi:hypothetical protein
MTLTFNCSPMLREPSLQPLFNKILTEEFLLTKPAIPADATNTGYVDSNTLGTWFSQAYTNFGWYGGLMIWQLRDDPNGTIVSNIMTDLIKKYNNPSSNNTTPVTPVIPVNPATPINTTIPITPVKPVNPVTPVIPVIPVTPVIPVIPVIPVTPINTTINPYRKINYPVRLAYVDSIPQLSWNTP